MSRAAKPFKHEGWYKTNVGGTRTRLCPVEDGFKAAEDALARLKVGRMQIVERGQAPTPVGPGIVVNIRSKLVGEVHDEYLDFSQADAAADTYRFYRDKLQAFFGRFADRDIRSLTQADGAAYKKWLRTEKIWKKGKTKMRGVGPTTVNHHLRAAKTLLSWAAEPDRDYLARNPWKKVKLLPERGRERLITDAEFGHLLAQCTDGNTRGGARDFRELLLVLRHTTMRPGEVRKLRWEYINLDRHQIVFPADVVKTKTRRPVTMIPAVEHVLHERKGRLDRAEGFVFPATGQGADGKRAAVVVDRCITGNNLAQRFRRLFRGALIKG
jgi:integrase